jgi:hypothetical protein
MVVTTGDGYVASGRTSVKRKLENYTASVAGTLQPFLHS